MKIKTFLTTAATLLTFAVPALAVPISDPGTFTPSAPTVTFDEFDVGTPGPLTVGDMTVSANGWIVRRQAFTQRPGIFEGQYFGQGAQVVTMTFLKNLTHIGFGLFDPNFGNTQLSAFDRDGNLLETLFPETGPPGGSFSDYVGFARTQGDIASVVITPQAGDLIGVDNISWRTADMAAVPLPAAAVLLLGALAGLFGLKRRRPA